MERRSELHRILKDLFGYNQPHVYFQPPNDQKIIYPCIVYKLDDMPAIHANNFPYCVGHKYQVTVIDRDPESELREKVATLPTCRMKTAPYSLNNLHHFVFSLFY